MQLLIAMLALVSLTAPFGHAEATAVSIEDGLTIEVSVDVGRSMEAVLVRPFSSFQELPPTALVPGDDGAWRGLVRLPSAANWSVVFDAYEPDGTTHRSETTDLLALGVDPVVVIGEPAEPPAGRGLTTTTWWLIASVVLVAVSLGLLTWWVFADREPEQQGDETIPG